MSRKMILEEAAKNWLSDYEKWQSGEEINNEGDLVHDAATLLRRFLEMVGSDTR